MNTLNVEAVVVSNNNLVSPNTPNSSARQLMFDALTKMSNSRKNWESNVYRNSNLELYSVLQNCYAADFAIKDAGGEAAEMRKGISDFATQLGFTFKESTPTINRIVRCVFGNIQRSRVSTYALVLREAKKQGVAIADIPAFIEREGGVQEIRLSKSATYTSPKQKAELARATAFTESLAVAKSAGLSRLANSALANTRCVLLATQLADGTFAINSVVRSEGAINAALVSHYSQKKSVLKDAASKQEAANDSQVRNDILQRIVNK